MLNNLLSGEFLALGGAALASLFAGSGSAKGVGIAGCIYVSRLIE